MSHLNTKIKAYNNVPTIFVNDNPVSGLMHWNRYLEKEDICNFSKAGVNFFSFLGNIDLADDDQRSVNDGRIPCSTMTHGFIDSVMQKVLEVNPEALVVPRFRMQASEKWKELHPQSMARFFNLGTNKYEDDKTVSLGCDEWISAALDALARSIEYCEKRWGGNIAGYHCGFGDCAEHAYSWNSCVADYNPEMLRKFRDWARQKYSTVDILRSAWDAPDITFENIDFPEAERFARANSCAPSLLNPQTDQALIDMMAFNSEHMAGLVIKQAQRAKATLATLGAQKIFGAFYCYMNLPANSISHYGHGLDAHEKVLGCKEIDFLSAPVGYSARQPGGVSTGQLAPASVELSGKLYYAEDDSGTHLTKNSHNTMPKTAEQSSQILTRGFLDVWRSGGTQWFMDLHGEAEHRDPQIMSAVKMLVSFANKHLDDRESCAEIAVFFSDTSLSYSKTFDFLTGNLIEQQMNEIASIGASYDIFRIEDLPELVSRKSLKQYKFAIMLNLHVISDELRDHIKDHLKKDNRTILWFHAPGIIHNGVFNPEMTSKLTGINCVMQSGGRSSLITEVMLDEKRFSYGSQRNVYPRLFAADPEAKSLGYIVEGTSTPLRQGSDGALLAQKDFGDYRSVWSGSPNMPSGLLAMFAEQAGVHIYCNCGSQVFNTENWLGIHAKWNGELKVKFPEKMTMHNALSGKLLVNNDDQFTCNVKRGENIILENI